MRGGEQVCRRWLILNTALLLNWFVIVFIICCLSGPILTLCVLCILCVHMRAHASHSSCLEARGHLGSWFSLSTLESWNQTWLSAISPVPYVPFTFHHLGTNEISWMKAYLFFVFINEWPYPLLQKQLRKPVSNGLLS